MGWTLPPPAASGRTGEGQSSLRLSGVQASGPIGSLGSPGGTAHLFVSGLEDGAADSLRPEDVASGDAVATTASEGAGTGGTTVGRRRKPEPAASAPPTSRR